MYRKIQVHHQGKVNYVLYQIAESKTSDLQRQRIQGMMFIS
jgi:hypothetical protein